MKHASREEKGGFPGGLRRGHRRIHDSAESGFSPLE